MSENFKATTKFGPIPFQGRPWVRKGRWVISVASSEGFAAGDRVTMRLGHIAERCVIVRIKSPYSMEIRPYRWTDRVVDAWRGFCRTLGQWFGP